MERVAILVDGGFFHKRANYLWGKTTPQIRAQELITHCFRHLNADGKDPHSLYRIFYYDCPPASHVVYHPFLRKQIDLSKTPTYRWMSDFIEELKKKRKVALRLGRLSDVHSTQYSLKPDKIKKLFAGSLDVSQLTENDLILEITQKGVDMKLGVDVASMAFKKQVTQIVLLAGDSDFVPAAKLARREGIDFILDPMYSHIHADLNEHIDGLRSPKYHPHPRPMSLPTPSVPRPIQHPRDIDDRGPTK